MCIYEMVLISIWLISLLSVDDGKTLTLVANDENLMEKCWHWWKMMGIWWGNIDIGRKCSDWLKNVETGRKMSRLKEKCWNR